MNNDIEKVLISAEEIDSIVGEVAEKINKDFEGEEVLLVVILKGSIVFGTDLMRKLTVPTMIDFMKASSYGAGTKSTKVVNVQLDLKTDIENKNVIIVEDIVDSGNTLTNLKAMLLRRNPKSLKICTLLDKPERRETEIQPDYVGTCIPDEFVVGYGLDYNEHYRELPYVGILSRKVYE